jgi:hypothetical protein
MIHEWSAEGETPQAAHNERVAGTGQALDRYGLVDLDPEEMENHFSQDLYYSAER